MKRTVALALGAALALTTGMAFGPAVRAGERGGDEKRIEKHVFIRHGGSGFLGVGLGDVEGDARGAKVRSVDSDSPAGKAGIKEGDVVVRFEGEGVRSAAQLARLVGETPAGRSVAIEVLRGGATQKLTATLGEGDHLRMLGEGMPGMHEFQLEMPEPPEPPEASESPEAPEPPHAGARPHARVFRLNPHEGRPFHMIPGEPRRFGVEFIDAGEQLAAHFKLDAKSGVLVTSVDEGTPAAKAGVKAGDVVLEFDGHKIRNGRELREAVASTEAGKKLSVKVLRDGRPLDLEVTLAKPEQSPEHGVPL
jgi:predicted metalloprotease with PDZ domain